MQSGERSVGEVGCIELFWVSTEAGKEVGKVKLLIRGTESTCGVRLGQ